MANFHKDEWFQEQLQRHWNWAEKRLGDNEIIAVLYTGSGNYGCDAPESDCDSWIIYFDKNYDAATYQVSQEPVGDEVTWVCDIRAFIYGCLQGDWMYTIAYFTRYAIINPRYSDLWQEFYSKREQVARISRKNATENLKYNANVYCRLLKDPFCVKPHKKLYYLKLISFLYDAYYKQTSLSVCFNDEAHSKELLAIKQYVDIPYSEICNQSLQITSSFINNPPLNSNNTKTTIAIAKQVLALIPRFERRANNG